MEITNDIRKRLLKHYRKIGATNAEAFTMLNDLRDNIRNLKEGGSIVTFCNDGVLCYDFSKMTIECTLMSGKELVFHF